MALPDLMPRSQDEEFERKTGSTIVSVKRGVYTTLHSEPRLKPFFKKMMDGDVFFTLDESQEELATFEQENGQTLITVNGFINDRSLDYGDKCVLLVSIASAVGLISQSDATEEEITNLFFDIPKIHIHDTLHATALLETDRYQSRKLAITKYGLI
jgi:predicted heme/steroid binding protein